MTFLNAGLLAAGVAAISIPIIIHLLMRRRRKPVQWGAMRFLLEAYKRTRRRLLVERWLLLAARCVLVALIAIAIGRPIVGALVGEHVGGRTVYILLDNSLAASAADAAGATALSRHVAAARATLESLGEGDRAGLVLLGAPADRVVMPPTANIGALGQLLEPVGATDARADIPAALAAVGSTILEARSRGSQLDVPDRTFVLLLSDLYRGSADIETTLPRLPAGVRLMAARSIGAAGGSAQGASALGNVTIESASPMRSIMLADQLDQAQTITVNLRRSGSAQSAQVSQVTLRFEGPGGSSASASHAGRAAVTWAPGQREATATVVLDAAGALGAPRGAPRGGEPRARQPGLIQATIDRDAVAGDNTFRVPVDVRDTLRVGIIGSPGSRSARAGDPEALQGSDWMALALRPREDVAVEVTDLEPGVLDSSRLAGLDAIVITAPDRVADSDWVRLRQFAESAGLGASGPSGAGGMLIVTPPGDRSVHTWTDAMTRGLGLSWSIAREAKTYDPASPDRPRVVAGEVPLAGSLLAPLRPELSDLARSVNMFRILPVVGQPEGGIAELVLSDGTGLVWVGPLGIEPKRPGATGDAAEPDTASTSGGSARVHGVFVYIACSLDLKWSDLPVKPLMVPLVQELVRQGVGRSRPSSSALAGQVVNTPSQTARLRAWKESDGGGNDDAGEVVAVDEWGNTAKPMRRAGVWDAIDAGGGRRGIVVVNADPAGGDVSSHEQAGLEAWLGKALQGGQLAWVSSGEAAGGAPGIKSALAARNEGRPTSAILLAAALLLAVVEMALARWASH